MILMKSILKEMVERRVNLTKLDVLMEKILPEIGTDGEKIQKLYTELAMDAASMNETPHTKFRVFEWSVRVGQFAYKADLLSQAIVEVSEKHPDVDFRPVLKAVNEIVSQ